MTSPLSVLGRSFLSRCTAFLLLAGALTSCSEPGSGDEGGQGAPAAGSNRSGIGADFDEPAIKRSAAAIDDAAGFAPGVIDIDPRRSLIVTEPSILSSFSLGAILPRLVPQTPGVKRTALQMFQQLWDTYNSGPVDPKSPHCNQNVGAGAAPRVCPRIEGQQATDPNLLTRYVPIALVNRVDLMPASGQHCGEYRIIYGRTDGRRAFVIFEGVLMNPNPGAGRAACVPVQKFWRSLSVQTVAQRTTSLRDFYFTGLSGFSPVLSPGNYGANTLDLGQVRTNVFQEPDWNLREFKLRPVCPAGGSCDSVFIPTNVKVTPLPTLFADATDALTTSFQNEFVTKLPTLIINDVNRFDYVPSAAFNLGDHNSQDVANLYQARLGKSFGARIQTELTRLGSTLTPTQVAARAEAVSCGGCHHLSVDPPNNALGGGVVFPSSLGFVHVTEHVETGPEGQRFVISPALASVFLPRRKAVMEQFLASP
jgi:hypothetical protein